MSSDNMTFVIRLIVTTCIVLASQLATASDLPTVKVGVLSYGTINWEIDTIKHHRLDEKYGVNVEAVKLTTKNAAAIALQGGAVDVILTDLFWVIKQGGKFKMHPTHKLSGGVYAKSKNATINDIDILGVAGGPNDKNLLILKAYLAKQGGQLSPELKYAAPPLLNEMMLRAQLGGLINFWHYNARLDAAGFKQVLSTQDMLREIGMAPQVPLLGWVVHSNFASRSPELLDSFFSASDDAKTLLLDANGQDWLRLRPKMKAKSEQEYLALIQHYPKTILNNDASASEAAARQLFDVVKSLEGQTLFRENQAFPTDIFID